MEHKKPQELCNSQGIAPIAVKIESFLVSYSTIQLQKLSLIIFCVSSSKSSSFVNQSQLNPLLRPPNADVMLMIRICLRE